MKMPKTIGAKEIVAGLMATHKAEEMKLLLIDFAMIRYGLKKNDPYLVVPVITDTGKAEYGLAWIISEIKRRIDLVPKRGGREKLASIVVVVSGLDVLTPDMVKPFKRQFARIEKAGLLVGIRLLCI